MSLIATLVPAYKHEHLDALFASLRSQSFKDFRVILCDDSPEGKITQQLRQGRFDALILGLDVVVVPGGGGLWKNHQRALDVWAGSTPLVHLLMDDDVVYPNFYREHATLHADRSLSASVSQRWLTRSDGSPFTSLPLPGFVTGSERRVIEVQAAALFASTVPGCENWLGELSNMVFSAQAAKCFPRPPADGGVSYFGLPDVGLLLSAADTGPVLFLRDHLSGFRQHAAQSTAGTQTTALKIAFLAWVAFALHAKAQRRIDDATAQRAVTTATQRCRRHYANDPVMREYFALVEGHLADLADFTARFGAFWKRLLASHSDTAPSAGAPLAAPVAPSAPRAACLVVLDDFFPNLLTGFRVAEYNAYLEAFPRARVLSCLEDFEVHHAAYAKLYPEHARRVQRFAPELLEGCDFAHVNFIENVGRYLSHLSERGIPFVMTLYPGGGFGIDHGPSNVKLSQALPSPLLRGVVTTQPITADYLREFAQSRQLPMPPLHEIPGVVVHPMYFDEAEVSHGAYFGEGKITLDVCFVAEKYMPLGVNKGYPEWVAAIHELAELPHLRFHVVGSFGAEDIDVRALGDRLQFHGRLETSQLRRFLRGIDVVVSLSRPHSLHPGNFDGFPTGSAVEASLCGAAVIASDVLGQNPGYVDGESMVIVVPLATHLTARMAELLGDPQRIGRIARAGQALTRRLYAPERQIAPRIAVLEQAAQELGLALRG